MDARQCEIQKKKKKRENKAGLYVCDALFTDIVIMYR